MPLGGFDRDFKKAPTTKVIKEDKSELYENLQKQLKLLRVQTNRGVTEIKELKKCVESISLETPDSLLKSLKELKQDIDSLQKSKYHYHLPLHEH